MPILQVRKLRPRIKYFSLRRVINAILTLAFHYQCHVQLNVGYGYDFYPHKTRAGNVTPKVVKTKYLKKWPLKVGLWGVDRTF